MDIEKSISREEREKFDTAFKPAAVHLALIKQAKNNQGIYQRNCEVTKIKNNPNLNEKMKKQMLGWNTVHLSQLVQAGYFRQISTNEWQLTPLAAELNCRREFEIKGNHIKILKSSKDGILRSADVKAPWRGQHSKTAERERKCIDGMIRNLMNNGYLEKIRPGEYRILDKAYVAIAEFAKTPGEQGKKKLTDSSSVKITYFDRLIFDCLTDGRLDREKINRHERRDSIIKRICTMEKIGYIIDDRPSKEYWTNFERVMQFAKTKELTIDMLTKEQLQTVKDMRLFLNLTLHQIAKYIYQGNLQLAQIDLDYLCRKKILSRDNDLGIYVFGPAGISLSDQIFPNAVRYKTKLHSRKEEVTHDMLVYSAFKEFEQEIVSKGGKILEIKNDRQLRSDYVKEHGRMENGFPDLRVYYKDAERLPLLFCDIEVDCGYDAKTVVSKIAGISKNRELQTLNSQSNKTDAASSDTTNERSAGRAREGDFYWVCKNAYQAAKVSRILSENKTKRVKASPVTVYWIDILGELHRV